MADATDTGVDGSVPEAAREFDAHAVSVRAVRLFVLRQLEDWRLDGLQWAAGVVATELAGNAVRHAATSYWVKLARVRDELLLEVHDRSDQLPTLAGGGNSGSEGGRGLRLVQTVARSWGVRTVDGGKVVWARLVNDDEARRDGVPLR